MAAKREEEREMRAWRKIRSCRTIEEVSNILTDEDITNETVGRLTQDWKRMNRIINFRIPGIIPA